MEVTPEIVINTKKASLSSETADFKKIIANLGHIGQKVRGLTQGIQMVSKHFCYQSSFGVDAIEKIFSTENKRYFVKLYGKNETDAKGCIEKFESLKTYFHEERQKMCHYSKISFDE